MSQQNQLEDIRLALVGLKTDMSNLKSDTTIFATDMREVKTAIIGTTLNPNGILQRLNLVEKKAENSDRKLVTWGAILSAAGTCAVFLKDLWPNHKA